MKWREMQVRVRKGQYWRKKDSGALVRITATHGSDAFTYIPVSKTGTRGHKVRAKELYMFWERV